MAEISKGENEGDFRLLVWAPLKAVDTLTLAEALPLGFWKRTAFYQSRERGRM